MRTALFPGTFDPVTNGHVDVAARASRLFDHVIVGIFDQSGGRKQVLFTIEERVALATASFKDIPNISVRAYTGLTVEFARLVQAQVIVRGLRAMLDFEQEYPWALMNRQLIPDIEVIWLVTALQYTFVSSSLLKEVASYGAQITELVPAPVATALQARYAVSTQP